MPKSRIGRRYRKYLWDPTDNVVPRQTSACWHQQHQRRLQPVDVGVQQSCDEQFPIEEENEENTSSISDECSQDEEVQHETTEHVESDESAAYDEPVFNGCKITVGAAIVLIMTLALRHHLPWVAVEDILTLLHLILPESSVLPRTRYLFEKPFKLCAGIIDIHYYCPFCLSYLECQTAANCSNCDEKIEFDLYKNGNFFIVLPLERQLRDMFENSNLSQLVKYRFDKVKVNPENIEDIYDGSQYKCVMNGKSSNHISLTWNVDGVPVFESSNYSMWPIQCSINELPPHLRKKHVLLAGLWFGPAKPAIGTFLKPFVQECNELSTKGFRWVNVNKEVCTLFVHALVCCADAVARCMLQGIKQFNGEFGCSWCLNPGKQVPKGAGTVRIYDDGLYEGRKAENFVRHAQQALKTGCCYGILRASPLLLLKNFDIVFGFAVDYMHCVLLGVTRALVGLWFDSEHHNEEYYVGRRLKQVDERLLSLRPPSSISRAPRSLKLRCYWKASEWRNWLLTYAVLCMNNFLPFVYMRHFLLLHCAIDILNGTSIAEGDMTVVKDMLQAFISDFARLYGQHNMSYNVHQLSHLVETVKRWGPLWTTSAFPFESGNGLLKKLFCGTTGLPLQVSRKFTIFRHLPVLAFKYIPPELDEAHNFFKTILAIYAPVQKCLYIGENVLLGQSVNRFLTADEKVALDVVCPVPLPQAVFIFSKAIVNGCVITAEKDAITGRRSNSCIMLKNGVCGIVVGFVIIGSSSYILFRNLPLGKEFLSYKQYRAATHSIRMVSNISRELKATLLENFECACIFVNDQKVSRVPIVCVLSGANDGD